jgi:hypothetical protein
MHESPFIGVTVAFDNGSNVVTIVSKAGSTRKVPGKVTKLPLLLHNQRPHQKQKDRHALLRKGESCNGARTSRLRCNTHDSISPDA